jgi:1,3-beta-glucanosyltransferase GAS1
MLFEVSLCENGINVAYHVDPTQDHDGCMQAFSDAGIYLFLDIDTFTTQIEETNPEWTYSQLTAFTAVIDAFSQYDNIAGFFVANEVLLSLID